MLGIGIGLPFSPASAAVALDPAVVSYAASVVSAGGALTAGQKLALNAFVVRTKATGVWTKLTEMGVFLGGTLGSAAVKFKALGAANCTLNNFVLADLTSAGIVSDGSTKWIDTGTTITQAAAPGPTTGAMGMGVFLTAECTQATGCMPIGCDTGGTPQVGLRWNMAAVGQADLLIQGGGQPNLSKTRGILPIGLFSGHRNGATAVFIYEGGVNVSGGNAAFTYTASTNTIAVCSGLAGANKAAMSCGMYYLGDGTWSDADVQNMANACNYLMVGLGRVVPDTRPFNYIPIIGQSLAAGSQGNPPLSTSQPYKNLTVGSGMTGNLTVTPAQQFWNGGGSGTGYQVGDITPMVELLNETIASGAGNTISNFARAHSLGSAWDSLSMNFALGSTAYSGLAKGTTPYTNAIASSTYAPIAGVLFATGGMTVPALFCVHGESDMLSGTYGANIRQWQVDYQNDLKAITGQSSTIPIFHSQPSCWTDPINADSATGISPYQILTEYETNPTLTILVCPKYFFTYSSNANQQIHLINSEYRRMGEYYGKAFYQHVVQGIQWSPLRPSNITRVGAVITVTFTGNVGNLQFDITTVTDPSGASNTKGFEYTDSAGGSIYTRISSVVLQGTNQVVITLTADPSGNTGRTLSYAYTGIVGNHPGPTTGPRGNLKDSDATVGNSGDVLVNWCVHFSKPVP